MSRKKHAHPPLKPPSSVKRWLGQNLSRFREKLQELPNDHGKEKDGRVYTFHPTKGWRNGNLHIAALWVDKQSSFIPPAPKVKSPLHYVRSYIQTHNRKGKPIVPREVKVYTLRA